MVQISRENKRFSRLKVLTLAELVYGSNGFMGVLPATPRPAWFLAALT
jgi:hypothetical protein